MQPSTREKSRRSVLVEEIVDRTGITEAMIADLVTTFYAGARLDPLLSLVFAKVRNWDANLTRLQAFWSSIVLMSGRYHGQPMLAHLPLRIEARHFDRWLALFERAATDVCPPAATSHFLEKARRIADSFEMAMATQRGEIASPRHAVQRS